MSNSKDNIRSGEKDFDGQALCPFCGSQKVYPIREKRLFLFTRVIAWSCANEGCHMYRKYFPSPSWGPDVKR